MMQLPHSDPFIIGALASPFHLSSATLKSANAHGRLRHLSFILPFQPSDLLSSLSAFAIAVSFGIISQELFYLHIVLLRQLRDDAK